MIQDGMDEDGKWMIPDYMDEDRKWMIPDVMDDGTQLNNAGHDK